MTVRGFILHSTYRLLNQRAVVLRLGRLQDGRTFLLRDDRQTPHFFIRQNDGTQAERLGARLVPSEKRSMRQEALVRVEHDDPQALRRVFERLQRRGIAGFETDVRFYERELSEKNIRGAVCIDGMERAPRFDERVDVVFDNTDSSAAEIFADDSAHDWHKTLRLLSIDIETDPAAERLLSIALVGAGENTVLILGDSGAGAVPCASEQALLEAFVQRVRACDPDIITGWNVVDFDLSVLSRIAARYGLALELGRLPGNISVRPARSLWTAARASVPGRVVLDGIATLRGAFLSYEDYSLDAIANTVLGTGKTLHAKDGGKEILRTFEEDKAAFVAYNRTDAELVLGIFQKLDLLPLTVARARLCGMPLDRVNASIASFDFLYLGALHQRGIVAGDVGAQMEGPSPGGLVLEPKTGLHPFVCVFDFRSLYPSLMRTFGIDPLAYAGREANAEEFVIAPNGAAFRRGKNILPGFLDHFFALREEAQKRGDKVASHALKILMNSFYGVLGTSACRFYSADISTAITGFGQAILRFTKACIEEKDFSVLYGDTDSLFVETGASNAAEAKKIGEHLITQLNARIADWVWNDWQVNSRLQLRFDKLYVKLFLPALRNAQGGARKRYAGLTANGDGTTTVEFVGLEAVRSDWTPLARQLQRELYTRWFNDQPVEEFLRALVKSVRNGERDAELVYRKALRKPLDAYAADAPHVVAARKMERLEKRIAYVITTKGAEPADAPHAPLDYAHYIDKQMRPIVGPVLQALSLDFDDFTGAQKQLRLF